jgi:hypothetical protein
MLTLEWTRLDVAGYTIHKGTYRSEEYAIILREESGKRIGFQFRGLKGFDLYGPDMKAVDNVETAFKICQAMMSAWRHKAH